MMSGTSSPSLYSVHDFLNKLFFGRVEPPTRPKPAAPCLPCMRSIFDAIFDAIDTCVPITFQHRIATPGEWTLSALVHQQRVRIPAVVELSAAERRAFAALGSRGSPTRYVAAESWRDVAEDSLERWWCEAHGATAKDLLELAREQTLRGLAHPAWGGGRAALGAGAVADTPVELRGISHAWLRAFFAGCTCTACSSSPCACLLSALPRSRPRPCVSTVRLRSRRVPMRRAPSPATPGTAALRRTRGQYGRAWLNLRGRRAPLGRAQRDRAARACVPPAWPPALQGSSSSSAGEPANTRPLHRAWCASCAALWRATSTTPTPTLTTHAPGALRIGGVDDDVDVIAQALQDLSWTQCAHDPIEAEVLQDALLEARGEAEVQMLTLSAVRLTKYSLPQHMRIRALYMT